MNDISAIYKKRLNALYTELKDYIQANQEISENKINHNPHITRLLQAFSMLYTNLHMVLEESFTEFIDSFFETLYPHYNTPIPAMTILMLNPNKNMQEITKLNKGLLLEMQHNDLSCKFQLCYNTEIMPLQIQEASCTFLKMHDKDGSKSIINLKISTSVKANLSKLSIKKLRFYISGIPHIKYLIYQNLFSYLKKIKVFSTTYQSGITLSLNDIQKVGFKENENVLFQQKSSFSGYRVLTEFFAFPEKFLFFDLDLNGVDWENFEQDFEVNFYLDSIELEGLVSKENFILNVAPVINQFSTESKPSEMNLETYEYPVIFDESDIDVCQLTQVIINNGEKEVKCKHLIDFGYNKTQNDELCYITRRKKFFEHEVYKNNTTYVRFKNGYRLLEQENIKSYFYTKAICSNGNLPYYLYKEGVSKFQFIDNTLPIHSIKCIKKLTQITNLLQKDYDKKHIITHFSPYYAGMFTSINGKNILKELFSIYAYNTGEQNQEIINNIIEVNTSEKILRIKTKKCTQFCKGTNLEIVFDTYQISTGLVYIFLNVFEYFAAMYCPINSFIKISGKTKDNKILYEGVPRNGEKCLI